MGKPIVIFRADGSFKTGLGHLVRSSALAEMISADFDCRLLYSECPPSLLPDLEHSFSSVERLPESATIAEELSILLKQLGTICVTVVLDGYQFDTTYQNDLAAAGHKVVCIDDIHRYAFTADLVINHAPSAVLADYTFASHTAFAFGTRFALLRKPFRELARAYNSIKSDAGIFVCLGGADPGNATLQVLKRLEELDVSAPVSVVIGSAYRYARELDAFTARSPLHLSVFHNLGPKEMAQRMAMSGIGITSPSTVCLEYLSTGGQLYLKVIADNQEEIYRSLIEKGQALDFNQFGTSIHSGEEGRGIPVIDGWQPYRYRALFRNLGISYRAAQPSDSDLYFEWANDAQVRAQSFSSKQISLAEHQQWFNRKLSDAANKLLLFYIGSDPIGQVRLTLEGTTAIIGYSVASTARGRGTGSAMLLHAENFLQRHHPEIRALRGYVKQTNPASIVTFRRLGYKESSPTEYVNALKFELHEL
ncbi:UDP-2,4-diacetamido-2,4,6-trideoxy-beta-L-altropyranose hydrolase [Neolewinella xylanilytica]|uniref:UDP-2,4-diacetamido-2,4, 6-trideoxy-beta-L-altropyranose hydrolase n=1 Tax=Neolewinella xylanilytica TaxID=1514080 RepID=A0A2S6I914_9BACT|nr:UDP-2,4-diacetamido-2,4,6-trideoxy-beta-L-altropyranose hydrolase [Neolewinella xylanilytica]PPK87983.1 UDP-2,4-diacetamido-2,4,6-trideoxy-beta-L-altropyranose hydrolase [Neolewinella xylanilytica]